MTSIVSGPGDITTTKQNKNNQNILINTIIKINPCLRGACILMEETHSEQDK